MIALIAIATVELCPVGDPLAEIQEMIIRPSAARWEQERTFQVLAGKQTFQRFHQAIWNRNLALLPILGDEAPLRLLGDPDHVLFQVKVRACDVLHLGIAEPRHPEELEQHALEWIAGGQELLDLFGAIGLRLRLDISRPIITL